MLTCVPIEHTPKGMPGQDMPFLFNRKMRPYFISVSYTHLDVYKRQILTFLTSVPSVSIRMISPRLLAVIRLLPSAV